jgi:hypothetical protein
MFAALHELLVDDLAGIVLAGLNVDGLLYNSIGAATQRLAGAILGDSQLVRADSPEDIPGRARSGEA